MLESFFSWYNRTKIEGEIMERFKYQTDIRFEEVLPLYELNGWSAYTKDLASLKHGFDHSEIKIAVFQNNECVGFVRAITDYATILYIQDLLVHPNYQGKSIGSQLLGRVHELYSNIRQKVLICDSTHELQKFYLKNGYIQGDNYHISCFLKHE